MPDEQPSIKDGDTILATPDNLETETADEMTLPDNELKTTTEVARPTELQRNKGSSFCIKKRYAAEHEAKNLWMVLAMICLLASIGAILLILQRQSEGEKLMVVDAAGTFHIGRLQLISSKSQIFSTLATQAMQAGWNRNPSGLDTPLLAKALFSNDAIAQLNEDIRASSANAVAKGLHSKAEVNKVKLNREWRSKQGIAVRDMYVEGQIVSVGSAGGIAVAESSRYKALLRLTSNPQYEERDQFPFIVNGFQIAYLDELGRTTTKQTDRQ